MKLYFLDKYGFPVTRFKNRPIINFIRLLIHTRKITTKRPKCLDPQPITDGSVTTCPPHIAKMSCAEYSAYKKKLKNECDKTSKFVECSFRPLLSEKTAIFKGIKDIK